MRRARAGYNRTHLIIAVMIIAINCAAIAGVLSAKYIKDFFPLGELKLSVKLDEQVTILEHKAERQDDGSYTLGESEVSSNEYKVMPGVDIKKDPQIVFKNKTAVPSYVYVKIREENKPAGVTYSVENYWKKLSEENGTLADGKPYKDILYVYCDAAGNPQPVVQDTIPVDADGRTLIGVLQNNKVYVSDTVAPGADFGLTVYGYVAQVVKDEHGNIKDAATTFDEVF